MDEKKIAKFDTLMEAFFEFMKHEKGGWDIKTKEFYVKYIEYRYEMVQKIGTKKLLNFSKL